MSSQVSEGGKLNDAASEQGSDRWVEPLLVQVRSAFAGRELMQALFCRSSSSARTADLLRLGSLMAVTMTLHNAPEGFAVRLTPPPQSFHD